MRGTNEWVPTKDLLLFEIVNNRDGKVRFVFVIGPSEDNEYKDALYDHLEKALDKKKQKKTKWRRMYSETHQINEDEDVEQQLKGWFDEFLKTIVPKKIIPAIESFRYPNN